MSQDYQFEPQDIRLSHWVGLTIWLAAVFARRQLLKTFCLDSGIAYPPENKHYHFNKEYTVRHPRIEYLAKVRDHIILVQYERFTQRQNALEENYTTASTRLKNESDYLANIKKDLSSVKGKLRRIKDPQEKLWLESEVANQTTAVKNQTETVKECQTAVKELEQTRQQNHDNWQRQYDIIVSAVDIATKKFINQATKKIQNRLNFTKFTYIAPSHSASVKEIMEE